MPANRRIDMNAEPGRTSGGGSAARPIAAPQVSRTAISSDHHVFLEGPLGKSLGTIMGELRTWLDTNKIMPLGFSCSIAQSGAADLHLTFGSRSDASRFEHAFGISTAPGAEKKQA